MKFLIQTKELKSNQRWPQSRAGHSSGKLPLLLMLGSEGIAVRLSTRIMPHNFIELLKAQIAVLQNKRFKLLPDFPQGGLMDTSEYDGVRARSSSAQDRKTGKQPTHDQRDPVQHDD